MEPITLHIERSGEWMPAEDLLATALEAVGQSREITIDLAGVNHLDASALQILLAIEQDQKSRQRGFHLANASAQLRAYFDHAGARERLLHDAIKVE
jgi:anti-anti-sigma regulatory factor